VVAGAVRFAEALRGMRAAYSAAWDIISDAGGVTAWLEQYDSRVTARGVKLLSSCVEQERR
jgi:hypothetical protein